MKKLFILIALFVSITTFAQENGQNLLVFELFTSQGCSSCPSADRLLDEVKKKHENVIVLSYHVDYWNRLGWKDPFSSKKYSDYQRKYGIKFGSRSIYTPQLVVNGKEHFTGSNHYRTDAAFKKYSEYYGSNTIELEEINQKGGAVHFEYKINGKEANIVTFALVVAERITDIKRGENRNLTLKNTNIVANRIVKQENSGTVSISLPDWIIEKDKLSIIGYTQDESLEIKGVVHKAI